MLQSGRFNEHTIEVTESTGTRGPDGYTKTGEQTTLSSTGHLQEEGRVLRERAAYYEAGDALFYSEESVEDVSVGSAVTINADGRTVEGTVEEVNPTDKSLLINYD
jgi:hypothetical protein